MWLTSLTNKNDKRVSIDVKKIVRFEEAVSSFDGVTGTLIFTTDGQEVFVKDEYNEILKLLTTTVV